MRKNKFFGGGSGWRCLLGPPLRHSLPDPKLKLQHPARLARPARTARPARPDAKKITMQKKLQCRKNCNAKNMFFGGGGWRCLPGPPLNHSRLNPKLKLQHEVQG